VNESVIRVLSGIHALALRAGLVRTYHGNRVVVLATRGRRSGKTRRTPLLAYRDGERLVLVASFGGSDRDPHWLGNLRAEPRVEVDGRPYTARIASEHERERLWGQVIARYPGYARYQARTSRRIPLVVLEAV